MISISKLCVNCPEKKAFLLIRERKMVIFTFIEVISMTKKLITKL